MNPMRRIGSPLSEKTEGSIEHVERNEAESQGNDVLGYSKVLGYSGEKARYGRQRMQLAGYCRYAARPQSR